MLSSMSFAVLLGLGQRMLRMKLGVPCIVWVISVAKEVMCGLVRRMTIDKLETKDGKVK